jgi:hypothetical protein
MSVPGGPRGEQEWYDTDQALWDARVPIHASGDFYDAEGFRRGEDFADRIRRRNPDSGAMRPRKPVPDAPTSGRRGD